MYQEVYRKQHNSERGRENNGCGHSSKKDSQKGLRDSEVAGYRLHTHLPENIAQALEKSLFAAA